MSEQTEDLRAIAQTVCPQIAYSQTHINLETALPVAVQTQPVVLCGSLYLIGQFYEKWPAA